jgi:amino acid transporter
MLALCGDGLFPGIYLFIFCLSITKPHSFLHSFFVFFVALSMAELTSSMPTSAGLYYFSAKMAPEKYAPLASWITGTSFFFFFIACTHTMHLGWANITGQVSLVCLPIARSIVRTDKIRCAPSILLALK